MLEHQEEYFAGGGRFPDRISAALADAGFGGEAFIWDERYGLDHIHVLGTQYSVRETIESAYALEEPLLARLAHYERRTDR